MAALRAYDVRSMVDYKLRRIRISIAWFGELARWFPDIPVPEECQTFVSKELASLCYWNAWDLSRRDGTSGVLEKPSDEAVRTLTGEQSWGDLEHSISGHTSFSEILGTIGTLVADIACVTLTEGGGAWGWPLGSDLGSLLPNYGNRDLTNNHDVRDVVGNTATGKF